MKRRISIVCPVLIWLFLISNSYNTRPLDINGWNGVKWGMTLTEIQNTLGEKVQKKKPKYDKKAKMYTSFYLRGIKIAETKFRVSFWMNHDTKKLARIVFVPVEQPEKYEWAKTFVQLEAHLKEKYGHPNVENTSNDLGTSAQRIWNFPSTYLELSYLKMKDGEMLLLMFSESDSNNI